VLFDYEHSTSLPFIKPALGIVPEVINTVGLEHRFKHGIRKYHGIKEDVYVASFRPDHSVLSRLGLRTSDIVATIRPPATEAHYHNPESEMLFAEVIDFLGNTPDVRMVILPRNEKLQGDFIRKTWPSWCTDGRIIIPNSVVNGLDLVWCSDFVISGGGTMNREAAALGVPVYSIFRGPMGAVDRYLSETGRLTIIHSPEEVKSLVRPVRRVKSRELETGGRTALREIVAGIEELL
jgi:predicted glycosyltransferase